MDLFGELTPLDKDIIKQHTLLVQVTSEPQGLGEGSVRKLRETQNKLHKAIRLLSGLANQFHLDQQPSMHTDLNGRRLEFRLDDAIHVLISLDQRNSFVSQPSHFENRECLLTTCLHHAFLASTPAHQPELCDQAQIEALIEFRIQKATLGANGHEMSMPSYKNKTPTSSSPIQRPTLTAPDCYGCS
jgi:hypothetical protein